LSSKYPRLGILEGVEKMFILKCSNCGNEIKIDETTYRVAPTDNFSIYVDDTGRHVEIECNRCSQTTLIR
jgi:DNA-directed RNA polymerase subunit RPC12/RpoP